MSSTNAFEIRFVKYSKEFENSGKLRPKIDAAIAYFFKIRKSINCQH